MFYIGNMLFLLSTLYSLSLLQTNTTEVQDIDLSRFVPKEVDNTGITVATMDRFTSRNKTQPTEIDNGNSMHVIKQSSCRYFKAEIAVTFLYLMYV